MTAALMAGTGIGLGRKGVGTAVGGVGVGVFSIRQPTHNGLVGGIWRE